MEARAHSREMYAEAGQISWIGQDLLDCSLNFKSSFKHTPSNSPSPLRNKKEKPRVCIVGAGLAGLRCAEILIEDGVEVTILEARDRLGGRLHQMDLLGHSVDTLMQRHALTTARGPNWIHGTLTNPIVGLAQASGTKLCLIEDNTYVFDQNGQAISAEKANKFFDLVWDIISEAFRYSNENSSSISPDRSLKDFFLEKVTEKGIDEEDQRLILQMGEVWGAFIGDPWDKQSLKYFWLEECLDGENLFVAGTHAKILQSVADKVLEKADILLGSEVLAIESTGDSEADPRVRITTADRGFEFDEVVVTVPLGCLKQGTLKFSPPLPPYITHAIQNTSYSHLEKVYVAFPAAFWDSSSKSETALPGEETRFQCFAHFLHPTYATEDAESWTVELNSLSSPERFGDYAQPTLLFCLYGPCATHITSLINSLSSSSQEYFTVIDEFFRPYYALLPNYDAADPNCTPKAVLATNWQNDRLAGCGSYMNFQVSQELHQGEAEIKLDDDIRALRRGMPERGVWIAGEHTAPFVALGTLTGAYWSGESVGMRILRAYGMVKAAKGKHIAGSANGWIQRTEV